MTSDISDQSKNVTKVMSYKHDSDKSDKWQKWKVTNVTSGRFDLSDNWLSDKWLKWKKWQVTILKSEKSVSEKKLQKLPQAKLSYKLTQVRSSYTVFNKSCTKIQMSISWKCQFNIIVGWVLLEC